MTPSGERFHVLLRSLSRAAVATIFLVLLIFLGYGVHQNLALSPDKLLARAYTEQRVLELRLTPGLHSPISRQRGQQTAGMNRPTSLLEGEAAIARGLRNSPDDGSLLAARGQANLQEWSYEAAITDMQEALDTQPKSAAVLDGLATAYFERAEAEDRFNDYGTAFELQSRALQLTPDNPMILFNRAITAARLYLFKQSIEDWQRYLSLDPSGEWSDEARQRLSEVRGLVDAHDRRTKAALLTPTEFIRTVDLLDAKSWEIVEPRIEDYLSVAITDWLPAAFPVDGKQPTYPDTRQALGILALILKNSHGDIWLSDLLSTRVSPSFALAISALSKAVYADNVTEDYAFGRNESIRAAQLFERNGNTAGVMRARFEEVYSLAFSNAGPECVQTITRLSPRALLRPYRWITIQLRLEHYACSTQISDVDLTSQLKNSVLNAQAARYAALTLRAIGFLADDERLKGAGQETWKLCHKGLQEFWSSSVYPMPGYNLYSVMDVISETDQRWHLDTAIDEEALTLVSETANPLMLAVENTSLAHAATLSLQPAIAVESLQSASRLLSAAVPGPVTDDYRLSVAIYEARIAAATGRATDGLDRLTTLHPQLARIANENVLSEYHRTLGDIHMLGRDFERAEREFSTAVSLAERQRSSITSEADRLAWATATSGAYRGVVEAKLRLEDPLGALGAWELYRGAELRPARSRSLHGTGERVPDATSTSAEQQISEEFGLLNRTLTLLDDRTVLVFGVVSDGVAIWLYDNRGVTERWVKKNPADLKMLADHLGELCATPSSSPVAIHSTAKRLYHILIAPVADFLRPAQTLVIEEDKALSGVPFQVLEDEQGDYLADRHPILYSPGLRYLRMLPSKGEPIDAGMKALVVANAAGGIDDGLRPLPDALSEARSVAQVFHGAKLLVEDEASLDAVRRELPRSEIFHFAGHAGARNGRIGLLLDTVRSGQIGVLDSWTLGRISLPDLRLAVLSACSTEKASNGSILEPESLARAILRLGVPSVVATRWNVDSESSAALMRTFYDKLLSGQTVARALGAAEADLRQKSPHPYYWAGFDALGQN